MFVVWYFKIKFDLFTDDVIEDTNFYNLLKLFVILEILLKVNIKDQILGELYLV
jgi:hypothetical protein